MRISDWSSDVCSSDLTVQRDRAQPGLRALFARQRRLGSQQGHQMRAGRMTHQDERARIGSPALRLALRQCQRARHILRLLQRRCIRSSEEHTSELQSLMRISYAVFCLKEKNTISNTKH